MTKIIGFILLLTGMAFAQALPNTVFFFGGSYDPNGGLQSASGEIGGAKLVSDSTYLGAVAHLGSKGVTPFQLSTKLQFHVAQKIGQFRGAPVFWTGEVGPEFAGATATGTPPTNTGSNFGYTAGSGPMVSISVGKGKRTYIMPHAEMVKGSLQDLGWRAGILFGFGSD